MSKGIKQNTLNMMSDAIFKAVSRSMEARGMITSVISEITDIKKRRFKKCKVFKSKVN